MPSFAQKSETPPQRYISQLYVIPAVDVGEAGKGQLNILVNQNQVPNQVKMQDAGRCLVTFIPRCIGTYVIDVTFNGFQVHGCPIKVDVNKKQVGQIVSTPIYTQLEEGTEIEDMLTPQRRISSMERGSSSSAYFSASLPRVDSSSYEATPTPFASKPVECLQNLPRSPPLVANVQQNSNVADNSNSKRFLQQKQQLASSTISNSIEHLRSPRLVQSAALTSTHQDIDSMPISSVGYTVAQYGGTNKNINSNNLSTPFKNFNIIEKEQQQKTISTQIKIDNESVKTKNLPKTQTPQFKMIKSVESKSHYTSTKSPELNKLMNEVLQKPIQTYKRFESVESAKFTGSTENQFDFNNLPKIDVVDVNSSHHLSSSKPIQNIYDKTPASSFVHKIQKQDDLPHMSLDKTVNKLVEQTDNDVASSSKNINSIMNDQKQRFGDIPSNNYDKCSENEPYSSNMEAMTPGTRRKLLENSVYKAQDLKENNSQQFYDEQDVRSETGSKHSSKATTPRLSFKFGKKRSGSGKDLSLTGGFDFGKSKITSKKEEARRGEDFEVKIESLKLSKDDQLKVVVMAPTRKDISALPDQQLSSPEIPYKLKKSRNTYEISFCPMEVGMYNVLCIINNQYHPQSPFPVPVYDASEIIVSEIVNKAVINDTVEFTVDARRAGYGTLEMAIKDSDQCTIPSNVSQLGMNTSKILVTFNPTTLGVHTVNIYFNKDVINGSPFEVNVVESLASEISEKKKKSKDRKKKGKSNGLSKSLSNVKDNSINESLRKSLKITKVPFFSQVGQPTIFAINLTQLRTSQNQINVNIYDYDNNLLPIKIFDEEKQDEKIFQFIPLKIGNHKIEVFVINGDNKVEALNSPFTFSTFDPSRIIVSKIPDGIVNKTVHFIVDGSAAGAGNLDVAIKNYNIALYAQTLSDNCFDVSFLPRKAIKHYITINYNGEPVPGSPFVCRVFSMPLKSSVSGLELDHVPINQPVEFWINVSDSITNLKSEISMPLVQISDPNGDIIQAKILPDPQEHTRFMVIYTPLIVGNHQIEIFYENEPFVGSPFNSEAFDANAVTLLLTYCAKIGRPYAFTIDASKAGNGKLEIFVIVDKREVPIDTIEENKGKFKILFTPQEENDHIISVKFNGIPIFGSPMRCPVGNSTPSALSPPILSKALPLALNKNDESNAHKNQHFFGSNTAINNSKTTENKSENELRLVGDLATAQVGCIKRFSIDAPRMRPGEAISECNVIITEVNKSTNVPVKVICLNDGYDVEFLPEMPVDLPKLKNDDDIRAEIVTESGHLINAFTQIDKKCKKITVEFVTNAEPTKYYASIYLNNNFIEERIFVTNLSNTQFKPFVLKDKSIKNGSLDSDFSTSKNVSDKFNSKQYDIYIKKFPNRALVEHITEIEIEAVQSAEKGLLIEVIDSHGQLLPIKFEHIKNPNKKHDEKGRLMNTFIARWEPLTVGRHEIRVQLDGEYLAPQNILTPEMLYIAQFVGNLAHNSFIVNVLDLSAVHIIGLRNSGNVGVRYDFQLDWHKSSGKKVSFEIRHENQKAVRHESRLIKQGLTSCSFKPIKPGFYFIDVFIDDIKLPECPYECEIINYSGTIKARGNALRYAQRGEIAQFEVFLGNSSNRGELDVIISDSRKGPLPVRCFKQHEDNYLVEFTPEKIGTHLIEITLGDISIEGSPFHCEVVDPSKVIISSVDEPITLRNIATIIVNQSDAGVGDLILELNDPHGKPFKLNQIKMPNGNSNYTFLPSKLGAHKLTAKLSGFLVPGTPKTIIVEEQANPCVYGSAIDYSMVRNQLASLIFDPKRLKGGLKIDVRDSFGKKVQHSTNKQSDGTTEITFQPLKVGFYTVAIEFNNKQVIGSPFNIDVVDPKAIILTSECFSDNDEFLHLQYGKLSIIDADATAAGPGELRLEARDMHGTEITLNKNSSLYCCLLDLGFGKHRIEITGNKVGQFKLYIYWSDAVIPSAYPLITIVKQQLSSSVISNDEIIQTTHTSSTRSVSRKELESDRQISGSEEQIVKSKNYDHNNRFDIDSLGIQLYGKGLTEATLREQAEFIIECNKASPGKNKSASQFTAVLIGTKADIPVRISLQRPNIFKCNYNPLIPGFYKLNLYYEGNLIDGASSNIEVIGCNLLADLIDVDTRTLKIGIIGEDVKTVIDARRAKAGHLSAQCVGPSQLEYCELFDNHDGTYILSITPKELGKHTLTIKYANEHVPNSPFVFTVCNPPNPNQVRVFGPGVEHGILHSFKSNFVVETKGAGAGQLAVRVRGPKGAFNVEMQRDRQQDRTIHCKYDPREPGDYQVEVKWHGHHVPGSPFLVIIVDTEEELQNFITNGIPSPQPPNGPFIPPGWVGHIPPPQSGVPFHNGHLPPPLPIPFGIGGPPPQSLIFRNYPPHIHPPHSLHSSPYHSYHAPIYGTRSRSHIYKND